MMIFVILLPRRFTSAERTVWAKRLILLERQVCITAVTKTVVEGCVHFHCRNKVENVNTCRRLTVEK